VKALLLWAVLAADGGASAQQDMVDMLYQGRSLPVDVTYADTLSDAAAAVAVTKGQYVELALSIDLRQAQGRGQASAKARITARDADKHIVRVDGLGAPFEVQLEPPAKPIRGLPAQGTIAGKAVTGVCFYEDRRTEALASTVTCASSDARLAPVGGLLALDDSSEGESFNAQVANFGEGAAPPALAGEPVAVKGAVGFVERLRDAFRTTVQAVKQRSRGRQ
jgi:hypothetical protein